MTLGSRPPLAGRLGARYIALVIMLSTAVPFPVLRERAPPKWWRSDASLRLIGEGGMAIRVITLSFDHLLPLRLSGRRGKPFAHGRECGPLCRELHLLGSFRRRIPATVPAPEQARSRQS